MQKRRDGPVNVADVSRWITLSWTPQGRGCGGDFGRWRLWFSSWSLDLMDFVYWFYIVICFLYELYVAFLHFWWTYELTRNLFTSGLGIRSHHRICQDQCRLSFLMANPSAPMVRLAIYCYLLLRYIAIWCFASVFQLWYWHDLTIWCCEKKSGKKLSPQCTVYSSKIASYDLAGMPPLWGGAKIKRWPLLGGQFWKLGTEVRFFGRVKQGETTWSLDFGRFEVGYSIDLDLWCSAGGEGTAMWAYPFLCLKTRGPARLAASHCLFLTSPVPGTVLSSKGEGARDVRWQKSHAFFRSCKQ